MVPKVLSVVCSKCSVKTFVTCVECQNSYHYACALKIIGMRVNGEGNIDCCSDVEKKDVFM